MASELGEVRVQIEQEGAQEAADTIGEAAGETGTGDGQAGGGAGGIMGGISAKLAGILAAVGFLASLKPIQEILSGIQRLFSITLLPLIALLTTFLRPILTKLLRLVASVDFENIAERIGTNLRAIFNSIITKIGRSVSNALNISQEAGEQATRQGLKTGLETLAFLNPATAPATVNLDWITETSRTSVDENVAETSSRQQSNNGVGGQ